MARYVNIEDSKVLIENMYNLFSDCNFKYKKGCFAPDCKVCLKRHLDDTRLLPTVDVTENYNFGDLYQKLDLIKKRYLQLEFLGIEEPVTTKAAEIKEQFCGEKETTKQELATAIDETIKMLTELISEEQLDDMEFCDYSVFTNKNYGSKYWNEIEHPAFIDTLYEQLVKVFELNNKEASSRPTGSCLLALYNLKGLELYFDDEGQVENFINENDVAPATLFVMNSGWAEEWSV